MEKYTVSGGMCSANKYDVVHFDSLESARMAAGRYYDDMVAEAVVEMYDRLMGEIHCTAVGVYDWMDDE